jgi:regulator of cell morphogenesis and NO signaling
MKIQAEEKVSRIAVEVPASIPWLESFGIRFYDSKPETLESACAHLGLSMGVVLEKLAQVPLPQNGGGERWDFAPLPALVRFILDNHHTWERNRVMEIHEKLDNVVKEEGERYRELGQLQNLFGGMARGFLGHMKVEEIQLFPPFLREVAPGAAQTQRAKKAYELIPLTVRLTKEHDELLTQWEAMRNLTGNFLPPAEAGQPHIDLLREVSELGLYQHQHIHKENFILFEKIRILALKR